MRNTITLNGTASSTITGLLIQSLPPITKPQQRTTIEEIDGRDGDIVTELGFAAYDKEITIGLYGTFDINQVIAYFNSEGTVTFSNEPDKLYNYKIINKIDFERLVRYRTATVTFHCQPFKYPTAGTSQTLDGSTVTGEGTDFYMPNTTEGVFAKFTPEGNTEQQTYTGKNKVDFTTINYGPANSGSGTRDGSTYTVTGVATGSGILFTQANLNLKPDTTYTFSAKVVSTESTNGSAVYINTSMSVTGSGIYGNQALAGEVTSATFTTPSTISSGSASIRLYVRASETATAVFTDLQVEESSTATSYEPYVGGEPVPNPDYPQNINVVTGGQEVIAHNKNLFKIPDTENTTNHITYTPHPDGTFDLVGTASASVEFYTVVPLAQSGIEGGVTYKPSTNSSIGSSSVRYYVHSCDKNAGWAKTLLDINKTTAQTAADPTTEYIKFVIRVGSGITINLRNVKFQLERGNTETAFQPYQSQTFSLNLGKNLFDKSTVTTGSYLREDGTTSTDSTWEYSDYIPILPNSTYTTSGMVTASGANPSRCYYDANKTLISGKKHSSTNPFVDTSPNNACYMRESVRTADTDIVQIEAGSTATDYVAYIAPIELCKIGDYQDYFYKDGDDWYLHKEIQKVVLDGTENWSYNSGTAVFYASNVVDYNLDGFTPFSDYFIGQNITAYNQLRDNGVAFLKSTTNNRLVIKYTSLGTNVSALQAWLSGHNTTVYYVLATPINTKITDTTLIAQLNAMNGASAYKGGTYVTSTTAAPNLPITIHAEMAGDMDATITNAGNIYARPKLTITGSGDIGVYLNGSQMFQIELGDEGEITIDTDTQEAYKGTTATLKNRLVTGDYSKFKLNPGANQLAFTGNATQCVVENYTRWL